jgi:hypothetical protein
VQQLTAKFGCTAAPDFPVVSEYAAVHFRNLKFELQQHLQ